MCSFRQRCFFISCILLILFNAGDCLQCYVCSSPTYGACGDEFGILKIAAQQCPPYANVCFKGIESSLQGRTIVVRGCSTNYVCLMYNYECSICKDNLCNASSPISPTVLSSYVLLQALIFKIFL